MAEWFLDTCRGCREVARLVGEVEDLRKTMGSLQMMVTGQGVEEKGGETGDRVAELEEAEKEKCEEEMPPDILTGEIRTEKETTGTAWTEERDSDLQIEVEQGTKGEDTCRQEIDGKEIHTGTKILATQEYKKNLDNPVGEEIDFKQGDTLIFLMEHEENKHWWLVEDGNGQVGYVPVTYIMIIIDETVTLRISHITTVIVTLNTPNNLEHVRIFIPRAPTLGFPEFAGNTRTSYVGYRSLCRRLVTSFLYKKSPCLLNKKRPSFL